MYQEWFKKFDEIKKKGNNTEECLCRKSHEKIDEYYLMSINECKGTLQIFKNRNGNFGMLFTEIPINYCPMCRKEAGINDKRIL